MCLELQCLFDVCFSTCGAPPLKSDLLLRVAKSVFISFVNYSTFWRPHQQPLLLRDYEETSPPSPPHSPSLIPAHTPLQIAWVYVPGRPVNFLPSVHRWADISGINLLLRIVMPMRMYTRLLSVIAYVWFSDCLSGCWFTQEIPLPPSLSLWTTQTRAGLTSWDKWRPNFATGDWAVANKSATAVFLML